jgi:U3 small nucleolar RNA-associated protein 19
MNFSTFGIRLEGGGIVQCERVEKMEKDADESITRKRKAETRGGTKPKRVKAEHGDDEHEQILLMEAEILKSKKHLNNVAKLLKILHNSLKSQSDIGLVAAVSLCRAFCRLIAAGSLTKRKDATEKDAIITAWLIERYEDYLEDLIMLLRDADSAKRVRICWDFYLHNTNGL